MTKTCECSDPGCPCCHGNCHNEAQTTVYRIDMEDQTGTDMCDECADDCLESGAFTTDEPEGNRCECGADMYSDCMGQQRCENCDPPCPHCNDGGGPV
jgi:hypothetical protein